MAAPQRPSALVARLKLLGGSRRDYVADAVGSSVDKVLDVGCAYGWALDALRGKANELWGVDNDRAVLAEASASYPEFHFVHGSAASLPFGDEEFDVVVLSEVIEHVYDGQREAAVDEAHRVLKPGGQLIFTAPYAGLLAWTDPLDVKRRLPSAYALYMRLSGYRPTTPPAVGHKHLSRDDIAALFRNRFEIEEMRFCGLLTPFVTWLLVLGTRLHVLPRRLEYALGRFRAWESGVPCGSRFSFNVRIRARKRRVR